VNRRRVVLGVGLALVLAFEGGLAGLVHHLAAGLDRQFRALAADELADGAAVGAALLAGIVRHDPIDPRAAAPAPHSPPWHRGPGIRAAAADADIRVSVTDARGRVVFDSAQDALGRDLSGETDIRHALQGKPGTGSADAPVLYVSIPIVEDGRRVGVVRFGEPVLNLRPFLDAGREALVLVGLSAGLAVIVLVAAILLWLLQPLRLLSDYLGMVRDRRYPERPHLRRTPLGLLGAAFDELLESLAGRHYVVNYVQALTHEIKSPLSAILAGAELLQDPLPPAQHARFVGDIQEQARRMQVIVERLLDLALLERRADPADGHRLDLGALLLEATGALQAEAQVRQIVFDLQGPPGCRVQGERFLLLRALDNLLRNALDFSPAGGCISVGILSTKNGYDVVIRDRGPGIPAFALQRVFERFYSLGRPDTGARSTGLGLSFAREIFELHRGRLTLANHPERGAVARASLPKA
jgi:two-component system sensor histidine kinase CreC